MKIKYLHTAIILFTFLINVHTIEAQEPKKKEIKPFKIEEKSIEKMAANLRSVFKTMLNTDILTTKKSNGTCKAEDLSSKISGDGLIPRDKNLAKIIKSIKDRYLHYPIELRDAYSRDVAVSFDIGTYEFMEDAALSSFSSTNKFIDFVKVYTGEDVGEINKYDLKIIKSQYYRLKENYNTEFFIETYSFMSLSCSHKQTSYIKLIKLDYPNATWKIRTVITTDCDCTIADELTKKIKSGVLEYTAETTGLLTVSAITFGAPKNVKVNVNSLVCCPIEDEKEESKIGLNDSNDDDKGYFQVGVSGGLPLGKEKDYYSFTYSADAAYLFNISDSFSAGAGVGYTRFTGKDVTFGSTTYEGEGTGFIPVFGAVKYSLSDKFDIRANVGYAISAEANGSSGLYYSFDLGYELAPNVSIGPRFSSINVEGGSFNSAGFGAWFYF